MRATKEPVMSSYSDVIKRYVEAREAAIATSSVPAPRRGLPRTIAAWLETRAARRRLLSCYDLDPRLAADIGLTHIDIEFERTSPMWRPLRRR
jgi:uncharacterized protein YjiS (DUF1127 family)